MDSILQHIQMEIQASVWEEDKMENGSRKYSAACQVWSTRWWQTAERRSFSSAKGWRYRVPKPQKAMVQGRWEKTAGRPLPA